MTLEDVHKAEMEMLKAQAKWERIKAGETLRQDYARAVCNIRTAQMTTLATAALFVKDPQLSAKYMAELMNMMTNPEASLPPAPSERSK